MQLSNSRNLTWIQDFYWATIYILLIFSIKGFIPFCFLLLHFSIYLLAVWTHEFSVMNNSSLSIIISMLSFSRLGQWKSFTLLLCLFPHSIIFEHPLTSHTRCTRHIGYFPYPSPEISLSPRYFGCFHWKNGNRSQNLGPRCGDCY